MNFKTTMTAIAVSLSLLACGGGEVAAPAEDPCGNLDVATGGWTGDWTVDREGCDPTPDMSGDMNNSNAGNNNPSDMGQNNGNSNNENPGNNDSPNNDSPNNDAPNNTTPGNNQSPNNDNPGEDMGCEGTCPGEDMGNPGEDMGPDMSEDMGNPPCTEGDCCGDEECCGTDCPPVCEDPVAPHRIVGIMLQLTNPDVPTWKAKKLVRNAVKWVSRATRCEDTKVLVILDDDHHNEFMGDAAQIKTWLEHYGYDVDFLLEPSNGLVSGCLQGYDVVWFTNPGWPVDDSNSLQVLHEFAEQGGGLVMSGDDMSQNGTLPILHLVPERNGTQTCGVPTDNNVGESYKVKLENSSHPVLKDISGAHFYYANDIDHSYPAMYGEAILAWAKLDPRLNCNCDVETPVIVAKDVPGFCRAKTCEADDGHPRVGIGYGHCINSDNPGHSRHGDQDDDD